MASISSPVGRALAGTLKNVAQQAHCRWRPARWATSCCPASAADRLRLGSMASQMFELELEAMDEQEAEYEVARRYVRLASTAAKQAARAPRSAPAGAVAKAARHHRGPAARPRSAARHARRRGARRARAAGPAQAPRRLRWRPASGPTAASPMDARAATATVRSGTTATTDDRDDRDLGGDGDGATDERSGERGRPSARSGRWVRRGRKIMIMGSEGTDGPDPGRRVPRTGGARAAHPAGPGPAVRGCTRRWSRPPCRRRPRCPAVDRFLLDGRRRCDDRVRGLPRLAARAPGRGEPPSEQQRRFTVIRLAFNDVLAQFDLFTEAVTQRSEHRTGVWLSGLDMLAADALRLPGGFFDTPPVICYLARGPGAAIRRARTRLPGGGENPVALIRVPRERMVGHGIASSLVHEVGHQAAALLVAGRVAAPGAAGRASARCRRAGRRGVCWHRWISEIVADVWSVAKLGIGATLGLDRGGQPAAVVRVPARRRGPAPDPVDPGSAQLRLRRTRSIRIHSGQGWPTLWTELYPPARARGDAQPRWTSCATRYRRSSGSLLGHRPPALRGARLGDALCLPDRRRIALLAALRGLARRPARMFATPRRRWPSPSSGRRARRACSPPSRRAGCSASCSPAGRCAAASTPRCCAPRTSASAD